jgi:hypothetical protein
VLLGGCAGGPDGPRIDDPSFVGEAQELCSKRLPGLRADISDDTNRTPEEVAPTVRQRADQLGDLVDDLKRIEVTPPAETEVRRWLVDWDTYVKVGRRYADALETNDPDKYSAVAADGAGPAERISAFARVNGFSACALDGVPLPERESPI